MITRTLVSVSKYVETRPRPERGRRLFFVAFVCSDSRRLGCGRTRDCLRGTCLIRYHLRNAILMCLKRNDFILKQDMVFLVRLMQTVGAACGATVSLVDRAPAPLSAGLRINDTNVLNRKTANKTKVLINKCFSPCSRARYCSTLLQHATVARCRSTRRCFL